MKISEQPTLKLPYWGYEPNSATALFTALPSEKKELRAKLKADAVAIKAAGLSAYGRGLRAKASAIGAAERVEAETGIEMHVYRHDSI